MWLSREHLMLFLLNKSFWIRSFLCSTAPFPTFRSWSTDRDFTQPRHLKWVFLFLSLSEIKTLKFLLYFSNVVLWLMLIVTPHEGFIDLWVKGNHKMSLAQLMRKGKDLFSCDTGWTLTLLLTCWAATCYPQRSVAAIVFFITFKEKTLTAVLLKSKQFAQGYLERRSFHSRRSLVVS